MISLLLLRVTGEYACSLSILKFLSLWSALVCLFPVVVFKEHAWLCGTPKRLERLGGVACWRKSVTGGGWVLRFQKSSLSLYLLPANQNVSSKLLLKCHAFLPAWPPHSSLCIHALILQSCKQVPSSTLSFTSCLGNLLSRYLFTAVDQ